MPGTTTPARDRLLDAAIEAAAIHGLARLSVGDVAKRAGLSRQTLYKHFPSKEALVAAAVLRETDTMVTQIVAEADRHDDVTAAVQAAVVATLQLTRDHPLLDRLMQTEPESLLPLMVGEDAPVAGAVRRVVEHIVAERLPDLSPLDTRRGADLLSRVLVSYAVTAPDDPPEVVAAFIAHVVIHGIGAPTDA